MVNAYLRCQKKYILYIEASMKTKLNIICKELDGAFAGANIAAGSTGPKGGNSSYGGCSFLTIDFYDRGVPEISMWIDKQGAAHAEKHIQDMIKAREDGYHTAGENGCLAFLMRGDQEPADLADILEAAAAQLRQVACGTMMPNSKNS